MTQDNDLAREMLSKSSKPVQKKSKMPLIIALVIVVAVLVAAPFVAMFVANKMAAQKLDKLFYQVKDYCIIKYEKVDYDIFKRNLTVDNLRGVCQGEETFSAAKLRVTNFVNNAPLPSALSMEAKDVKINTTSQALGRYGKILREAGYDVVSFDSRLTFTLGSNSKEFKIDLMQAAVVDVGVINMQVSVPNITSKTFDGAVRQIWGNKPVNLWVSFKDGGLADRVLAVYSAKINKKSDEGKKLALAQLEKRIDNQFKLNKDARERVMQIYRFFQAPSELVIKMDNSSVSMGEVVDGLDTKSFRGFLDSVAKSAPEITAN